MAMTLEQAVTILILTSGKIILTPYKSMASGALFQGRNDSNASLAPTVTGRRKSVFPCLPSVLPCLPPPQGPAFAPVP